MGPKKQGFWPKINCSQMKLPNFVSHALTVCQKLGIILENEQLQQLKLSKNGLL